MRNFYIFFVTFAFISLASLFVCTKQAYAIDGFIRITSPSGGETLQVGNTYTIRWESSSNIDKVNIGYKSCPSCLDWVVFTTPNTGSYDWNVNIGNTTQTQFTLQITGYETGKGSLTSSSGTFTVLGGSSQTSSSYSSSSTSIPSSSSINLPSRRTDLLLKLKKMPTLIPPTPTPIPLSVYTIWLPSEFIFEGSQTTNLHTIKDPRHVKDFTIDTQYGWIATFSGELDLTDKSKLTMLRNMDKYWVVEWWFIWIKIEWWEVFSTPCTVTIKNKDLTGVQPKIVTTENVLSEVGKLTPTAKPAPPTVKKTSPDGIVLSVTSGGKFEVEPNVFFKDKPASPTDKDLIQLTALTSHKNLIYHLLVNGKESSISAVLKKDGSFDINIPKLTEGNNYIELRYKKNNDSSQFTKADDLSIVYKQVYFWYIVGGVVFIALLIGGNIFWIIKHHKHKKRKHKV
ncbi:hypothetical protein A2334_04345 [Candidatus Roizmanbacteria bacterium RIFOXYB2_FULL_38_10]|uniref:Uncharacterized protein n=1 Tax=Candidatus Roizmanbacteria bacterium RIFOXYD1_FULL_38_12 TaxID=1802093 RepID=A0A1F7KZH8_9BACT|nr:MAG: hypothetical protein A3K47_00455 [Candidatus Roizmanbacteria bacterium RIFOXYA2_FULL_38_14]OGK63265.1 MAG: hypothetical protein A3K27_00455 [Candidatus Roizmanbacteria bacterium RIFOXYA1_FULL_37_12]OGK65111.1 MAG: hypothetical protein A3K38_00455 [Candidatus Roizmanbacteria bacterium RIFOXYB1_FULL_40_23]OGK68665.1 MAG: hypothetical protein A2334_04345 [Candidatus Roizmanbacteria bacterium RIFOXYB2_FULL_38_10]OGK69515.1 MAG: hypothetical protein A3K21_00455 [Candidatus Roizmanbacteria ba